MRSLRILLVEDDSVIGALIAELLVEMGHVVCAVVDTEAAAVLAAAAHVPDLMIVDNDLRVGNGVSAMATILGRVALRHIYMTGGARNKLPPDSIILHKPFGRDHLVAALEFEASR